MKYCIVSALLCVTIFTSHAQTKLPNYGKIDKEDLLMKECASDKSAPAMVLADEGSIVFNYDDSHGNFEMEKTVRRRIKVFTDKGLDYANVKIQFYSDDKYEQVSGVSGNVYNLDEGGNVVTTKLSKDQIFKKKDDDRFSSVSFSLPGVKAGTVFEYRYTIVKKSFRRIDPWVFQREIPTRASLFEIEMPEFFRFVPRLNVYGTSVIEKNQEDAERNVALTKGVMRMGVTRYRYLLKDVQALRQEPYMSGYKNYLQRITLQLSALVIPGEIPVYYTETWQKLAEELYDSDYFGGQLKKNVSVPQLDKELEKAITNKQKIECIHRYMRNNYEWNGGEDFYCSSVKKIADQRSGTTGDLNLLFLNLLKSNGVEAYPLLISTRDNGSVLKDYPFLDQFNSLNVAAKDGEKWYFMNAADKYNPMHLIPYDVMTTNALFVNKANPEVFLVWDESMTSRNTISYMATVSEEGAVAGDVFLSSAGYAKNPKVKSLKNGEEKYIAEYYKDGTNGLEIEGFSVKNAENDSLGLEERFKFKTKLQGSGEYLFFNPNMFTGLTENPFVAETRVSDIDFGYLRRTSLNTQIIIPDNFEVEELPKAPGLLMADSSISFRRTYIRQGNTIILRMMFEINRPIFGADEYADFKEFYKKLYAMLNEQIVMKKKK